MLKQEGCFGRMQNTARANPSNQNLALGRRVGFSNQQVTCMSISIKRASVYWPKPVEQTHVEMVESLIAEISFIDPFCVPAD